MQILSLSHDSGLNRHDFNKTEKALSVFTEHGLDAHNANARSGSKINPVLPCILSDVKLLLDCRSSACG
jgi:hypothetical protein